MTDDRSSDGKGPSISGLDQLGALVAERMGLHFPENKRQDLWRAVQSLAREHGQDDTESFLQSLLTSSLTEQQVEMLAPHVTVGETYFFRETKALEAFRDHVLPERIRHRSERDRRLRIWSAGCGSGEEPYTLAMLIESLIPDARRWDMGIYGTDINPRALEKARRGVYTEWSFRGVPGELRSRHFEPAGRDAYRVTGRLKDRVSFAYHNLATDDYPSLVNNTHDMDVIFCRNVMIYFTPQKVQRVIERFHRCLVEGGWLIVAPSETSILLASEFTAVPFEGATLYRKLTPKPREAVVQVPAAPELSLSPRSVAASLMWPEPPPTPPALSRQDPTRRYETALAAYRSGHYDDVVAILQTLLAEAGPEEHAGGIHGDAYALMARTFANQGNLEQALQWCEKAVRADKTNPRYCYLLAMILLEQGRETAAVQALKRSLYLDPGLIAAHYTIGNIAIRQNRPKAASRHFHNALSLLSSTPKETTLPALGGMTAGRLRETIQTVMMEGGVT